MSKKRIVYIDFMKGVCILLVVAFHLDNYALGVHTNEMLQSFRIPMYFFLSGLFFKTYDGFADFSRRKINNIIIPLVFFLLLSFIYVFVKEFYISGFNYEETVSLIPANPIENNIPLWFLVVLFEVNIIYYLLQKFLPRVAVIVVAILLSAVGYFFAINGEYFYLYLDIAFVAMPFFILGSEVRRLGLLEKGPHIAVRLAMVVAVLVVLYIFAQTINLHDRDYPSYIRLYVLPCMSILTLMFVCQYIKRPVPIISHCGRYSIMILGTHALLTGHVYVFFTSHILSLEGTIWLFLIMMAVMIALEYPIIYLFRKFVPRLTAQKEFFHKGWKLKEGVGEE